MTNSQNNPFDVAHVTVKSQAFPHLFGDDIERAVFELLSPEDESQGLKIVCEARVYNGQWNEMIYIVHDGSRDDSNLILIKRQKQQWVYQEIPWHEQPFLVSCIHQSKDRTIQRLQDANLHVYLGLIANRPWNLVPIE